MGVGSFPGQYEEGAAGYSKALARGMIAEIRTDLDAFTDAERRSRETAALFADAALRRHVPALLRGLAVPPAQVPHPDGFAGRGRGGDPRGAARQRERRGAGPPLDPARP